MGKRDAAVGKGNAPEMSVVIVTPDNYQVIRRTIRYLRAQTVTERLEVVIAAPSCSELGLVESDLAGFRDYKVVEVGKCQLLAEAKAMAVPETSASVVAFAEDHCFPEPNWAEALLAAHRRKYAAVGPEICNANPATALSWAGLFLYFGHCVGPVPPQLCTNLPWHNTSYKRHLLLEYGPELASLLTVEGLLLDDLRTRGHRLYFEPAAKVNHVNISLLSSWIRQSFWGGKLFGAMRAQKQQWPIRNRIMYAAGSPLIPIVRLYRTSQRMRQVGAGALIPKILPAMIVGLFPHAAGEVAGYLFGLGRAAEQYSYFETKRMLHVTPSDRNAFLE